MSQQSQDAIRAAKNWKSWGRFATIQFLRKRGVNMRLYYLARLLENCDAVGV